MNPSPIIDLPTFEALKEAMGADYLPELVQAYLDETPQLLSKLKQALAKQDCEAFRQAAHFSQGLRLADVGPLTAPEIAQPALEAPELGVRALRIEFAQQTHDVGDDVFSHFSMPSRSRGDGAQIPCGTPGAPIRRCESLSGPTAC